MDIPSPAGRRFRHAVACRSLLAAVALALCDAVRADEPADEPPGGAAAALPAPAGEVLLVVRGAIERTNVGDEAHLDRALIEGLPRERFVTGTPWSEEESHVFEGARLSALLEAVGATGTRFEAIGADDYAATFEGVDLERYPVILADTQDGTPLTLRRLGPLRIMFPFDEHPELLNQSSMAMAVWQLVAMDVR